MVQNKRGLRLNKLKTYTLVKIQQAISLAKKLYRQQHRAAIVTFIVVLAISGGLVWKVQAETYPGGTDNGLTSRIKTLSDSLTSLGYGSTTDTPDWGAMWNRIKTAATWTPPGDVAPGDIRSGKKYYNGSRSEQTGAAILMGPCPTQSYTDVYAESSPTTNCYPTWINPTSTIEGDDKKDPVTGLIWSKPFMNSSGAIVFITSTNATNSNWSWDANLAANIAVGNKTAPQVCSEVLSGGNIWRLPTQKELLQAYIDGASVNLVGATSSTAGNFWSSTVSSVGSPNYYFAMAFYNGDQSLVPANSVAKLRCVREE